MQPVHQSTCQSNRPSAKTASTRAKQCLVCVCVCLCLSICQKGVCVCVCSCACDGGGVQLEEWKDQSVRVWYSAECSPLYTSPYFTTYIHKYEFRKPSFIINTDTSIKCCCLTNYFILIYESFLENTVFKICLLQHVFLLFVTS